MILFLKAKGSYIYELTASGGQCMRTATENKVESEVQFDRLKQTMKQKKNVKQNINRSVRSIKRE